MLTIHPEKIYISSANVDMRKSIDGLSAIVEQNFKLNQFSNSGRTFVAFARTESRRNS